MADTDGGIKLPIDFTNRIFRQFGDRSTELFKALSDPPALSVRINPSKWSNAPVLEKVPWSRFGYYLGERPSFTLDPWLHAGAYYVQEPGSMLLERAFMATGFNQSRKILDLCGAPGGKSTHLLSLLSETDLLVSNEVIRSRAIILQENIQKWGFTNVLVTNNDPRDFSKCRDMFDVIVTDAPCSGEGLFRKEPSSIQEWSVNNTQLCAARQKRILSDAWDALKDGGYMIYSTCTYNPAENEENLQWLAGQHDAESVEIPIDPSWNIHTVGYKNIIGYQMLPGRVKAEGFFIGILRKKGHPVPLNKKQKTHLKNWIPIAEKQSGTYKSWIKNSESGDFLMKGNEIYYLKSTDHPVLAELEKHLYILQAGLPVVELKGKDLIPHHALALSNRLNKAFFPGETLNLEGAIQFLRRDTVQTKTEDSGWVLADYRGLPLGWLKRIGNRTNNYFPKEWRIRMNYTELPSPWHEKET
jgi:16S rRNA C967 or C1407 C5-methylase (RsmB/RsmF family)/NOL1/NOP2/fmu family ribosome biogenesis protein